MLSPSPGKLSRYVPTGAQFQTTRWEMVRAAGADSEAALEHLCRAYWAPIFAFVRRQGHDLHQAQDLTQEFFSRILSSGSIEGADEQKGRFRSFLLGALKHFLTNEWHRANTQKRGGGKVIFSIEQAAEEDGYSFDIPDADSPDRIFDRRWAETLIARVNVQLRKEYEAAEWGERFEAMKVYLLGDYGPVSYAETAAKLNLTESAVKSAIYKLRQRFGQLLRAEVAQTIANPEDSEDELEILLHALGG